MSTGLVLLDLDGTLYEAGTPVPGAAKAVERLRADGHVLRFFTKTSPATKWGSTPPRV